MTKKDNYAKTVGKLLDSYKLKNEIKTDLELSRRLKVNKCIVTKWRNGDCLPSDLLIIEMGKKIGMTTSQLLKIIIAEKPMREEIRQVLRQMRAKD